MNENKTKVGRQTAKSNNTNSTSFSNNAIQNMASLTKADKHNLRKYDNKQEQIKVIKGTKSITNDVKDLYKDLFEEARIQYNKRQTRNDRKIDDYFTHIANDDKHDLAVEIIIELGDMNYWNNTSIEEKRKMIDVFKEQCNDLEIVVPNFKIANATIHFDETSPHLHIIGVAYKNGNKNGISKQVGKATVFTKESLIKIQDEMRERCIESFNRIYNLDYVLKDKEKGRNKNINVKDMQDYFNFKKDKNKFKDSLNKLNDNANNLTNNSKELLQLLNSLKTSPINRNIYHLSNNQKEKLEHFINEAYESSLNMLKTNHINSVMKEYEYYLDNHDDEIYNLKQQSISKDKRLFKLENDYKELKNKYDNKSYENIRLTNVIKTTSYLSKGLMNFISKMCSEGYIPQKKYEKEGTLFREDKGKWINGKYYSEKQLERMHNNDYYI